MLNGNESINTVYATEASQTQSQDAYLKTFSATPGTMTPAFSPSVTSYTMTIPADVDKLNVTCSTADANATVTEAKGFKNLKMGSNSAVITVKGPSGSSCSYYINIVRGNVSAASNPAEGAGITLATNNTATQAPQPVQQPEATPAAPTVTETTASAVAETPEQPVEEAPVVDETTPEATEDMPMLGEAAPEAVETMAAMPDTGEKYVIGGESIYADYYVTSSFDTSLLPEGFTVEPYNFNGATVQSGYLASGNIRLLYSESVDGTNAGLRIYYEDDKDVYDFVPFLGYNGYVFPVRYQAQIPVPTNYTGSFMPFDKKVVSCYIYTELTDNPLSVQEGMENKDTLQPGESTADADPVMVDTLDELPEFYLFYGMNNQGQENFYLYDWTEGTYQRYVERDTSYDLDQSYFKYKDMAHSRFVVMCILIFLLIVAAFVIVNLYMKNKELKRDMDGFDPDDDGKYDDDDDNDNDGNAGRRGFGFKFGVVSKDSEEDDYDSDDDEVYEDGYEEEYTDDEATEEYEEYIGAQEDYNGAYADAYVGEDGAVDEETSDDIDDLMPAVEITYIPDEEDGADDGADAMPIVPEVRTVSTATGKRPEFKMINLSREPEPSGIDDDFEFEFIHLEDD